MGGSRARSIRKVTMPTRDYLIDNALTWSIEYLKEFDVEVDSMGVRWNRRFKTTIARATFEDSHGTIELSSKIYPSLLPLFRVRAIAHETCHIGAWALYGFDIRPHGFEWKELMRGLGFSDPSPHADLTKKTIKKGDVWCPQKSVQRFG